MKLDDIGFYTLSEQRAKNVNISSPIARAEILLSDKCNLKCPYCRGLENKGDLSIPYVKDILGYLYKENLVNIRLSGGEPTLYPFLKEIIWDCNKAGIKRIAISTNGTVERKLYKDLISLGVNDFSISLDSGCCSMGEIMTGGNKEAWGKTVDNIKYLSQHCYVTVGVVFNEINYYNAVETIAYIDSLNPSDIRVIPSAQYNKAVPQLVNLPKITLKKYPILNYRIKNFRKGKSFRGLTSKDCPKCYLVLDDIAISGKYQFPCIIYLREQGKFISIMDKDFRQKRVDWFKKHNSFEDNICRNNCLDVCVDYNNRVDYYVKKNSGRIF